MKKAINPLQIVLDRLGCCDPVNGALFLWNEVNNWPPHTLEILVGSGLLQPTQPVATIECNGCEENCIMPVIIYPTQCNKPGRAFINCDKRDDIGRVPVNFHHMEQWQATDDLVAKLLTKLLKLSQTLTQKIDDKQWHIGTLLGNKHRSLITLLTGETISLSFSGHIVPLINILSIKDNMLVLDKTTLIRLVNSPANQGGAETPEVRRERLKTRIREEKAKGTKAFLQMVAKEEGISVSRLKQIRDNDIRLKENTQKNSSMVDLLLNAQQAGSKKSRA